MRIRLAEERDRHAWDRYAAGHPEGLAYHCWAWKKTVESAYGFPGFYLLAKRGDEVCGILPMIRMKRPLCRPVLVSLPYSDVGGCLADDDEVRDALEVRAKDIVGEIGATGLELRHNGHPERYAGANGGNKAWNKVRMLLDLPGDSRALLDGLKAKVRSQARKPERDGLSVRLGRAELMDEFYRVFAENMRDLGSPVHSRTWFEGVIGFFGTGALVGVVSTPDGRPAAAGILLMHPTTVSVPWASSLRRYNSMNPNMLLYWSFLAHAADHGYRVFDFGRSTKGEGTYRFKKQWGANPSPLFWHELKVTQKNYARRCLAAMWSRLPVAVSTLIGPSVRRHIKL